MSRRRVLHCIPGMGGGGAERQLVFLAEALPRFGWEVHVALKPEGPNLARLASSGARIHHIGGAGNYDPRILLQLLRTIGRTRPHLVQVWMLQMEVLGALAATCYRIPWILSERSSQLAYPRTWKNRLRVALSAGAAGIVANSTGGELYWSERRGELPRFVVPNAVPVDEIETCEPGDPRRYGLARAGPLVLFVGRLTRDKNVMAMFRALAAILLSDQQVTALLVGEGELRAALQAEARAGGFGDRVALPGYVDAPWGLMKRAAAFVSLSHFEGHPNAVLEAAACRAPLVLSDIPAHRGLFDDRCALFVAPDDVAAIAAALRQVLNDGAAARDRAAHAYARVAPLTVDNAARKYDCLYRQVLHDRGVTRDPLSPPRCESDMEAMRTHE